MSTLAQTMTKEQVELAQHQAEQAAFMKIIKDASDLKCDACSNLNFIQVTRLKKISGLVTGTGKDSLIPLQVYACSDCGHVNDMFLSRIEDKKPTIEVVK